MSYKEQTHCARGHEYPADRPAGTKNRCLECSRLRWEKAEPPKAKRVRMPVVKKVPPKTLNFCKNGHEIPSGVTVNYHCPICRASWLQYCQKFK